MNQFFNQRVFPFWKLKCLLGGLLCLSFWTGYFLLQKRSAPQLHLMPVFDWELALPLFPQMAWIYISQFLSTPLILWLAPTRRALLANCLGVALMTLICFALYFLFPTTLMRPESMLNRNTVYDWILTYDLPRNACPSLHAGFAVFLGISIIPLSRGLNYRALIVLASTMTNLAVLMSTLLIRQHVFLDLLAGGTVGLFSYLMIHRQLVAGMESLIQMREFREASSRAQAGESAT